MSTEDKSRKTEEATPQKLRKSRERGEVPRSKLVVSAMSVIGTIAVAGATVYMSGDVMLTLMHVIFRGVEKPFDEALPSVFDVLIKTVATLSLPAVAASLVLGIGANLLQFGFVLAPERIAPKFSNISPISGAKRMVAGKHLVEIVLAAIKIIILMFSAVWIIALHLNDFRLIVHCGVECGLTVLWAVAWKLMAVLTPMLIAMAVIDWKLQKAHFLKEQRMTKDEVKREQKDTQGNPEIKQQRKSLHRAQSGTNIRTAVTQARVVLADATRVLVIAYDPELTPVPRADLRRQGAGAGQIITLAGQLGQVVVEDADLMEAIWPHSSEGDYLKTKTFESVAQAFLQADRLRAAQGEGEGEG